MKINLLEHIKLNVTSIIKFIEKTKAIKLEFV